MTGPRFRKVAVADRTILLTRLSNGAAVAFGVTCGHQQQPLTMGELTDDEIDCPHHHYRYDAHTGRNTFPGADYDVAIDVYETREADGWVWVRLEEQRPQDARGS